MEIQVFGASTEKTAVLARQCQLAAAANGNGMAVHRIANRDRSAQMGIDALPAVAINGVIRSSGRIPARQEIDAWIAEAAGKLPRQAERPPTVS